MNKERRNAIADLCERLNALQTEVVYVHDAEAEYRDSIPENMRANERYEKSDAAVDSLDWAVRVLGEAMGTCSKRRHCKHRIIQELTMPERIQLRRMKSWRMPPNTRMKVDRSLRQGLVRGATSRRAP